MIMKLMLYVKDLHVYMNCLQVDTSDELQVASVVSDDGTQCVLGQKYSVALLPSTMVTFIARRYRFVIILDVSPSVSSVVDI
jgi:hypothetical protein